MSKPTLASGIPLEDLYLREGLVRLDRVFLAHLRQTSAELHRRLLVARGDPSSLTEKARSELMIELASYLEDFLAEQFGIARELAELQARHHEVAPLYSIKRKFVLRKAISGVAPEQAAEIDGEAVARKLERFGAPLTERVFAERVSQWLEREPEFAAEIGLAARYAAWATLTPAGRAKHKRSILFKTPHKLDFARLVPVVTLTESGAAMLRLPPDHWRGRRGFQLTDAGMDLRRVRSGPLLHKVPQSSQG